MRDLRPENVGTLGKGNKLCQSLNLQLLHQSLAMGFDRALGRAQCVRGVLVGVAANNPLEDLPRAALMSRCGREQSPTRASRDRPLYDARWPVRLLGEADRMTRVQVILRTCLYGFHR